MKYSDVKPDPVEAYIIMKCKREKGPGPFLYLIDWEIRLAAKDFNLCLANLLLKMQC